MRKNKSVTIVALIIAIIGLSIGFAAFSNTLTIRSSADVHPDDSNFIVQFSKVSNADQTGNEYPIVPNSETYGDNAIINSSNKKLLEGVHAKFTAPNQSVTYNLYVRNAGSYLAYLKDLTMGTKTCEAATTRIVNEETVSIPESEQATASLVSEACNGISISVTIGTVTLTSSGSLNNQSLQANGGSLPVTIVISYAEGSSYVDGPMEVDFGDITFTASTNPGTSQQGSEPAPSGNVVVNPGERSYFGVSQDGTITGYDKEYAATVVNNANSVTIPSEWYVTDSNYSEFDDEACANNSDLSNMCSYLKTKYQEGDSEVISALVNYEIIQVLYTTTNTRVNITKIGPSAFIERELENVVLTNSITEIGQGAFANNRIESLTIPSNVTTIGDYAFQNNGMKTLTLSNGIQTIGQSAFDVNDLRNVTIPSSVETIGSYSFMNNPLQAVVIGNSSDGSDVISIGSNAFNPHPHTDVDYPDLTSVTIYADSSDVIVGEDAFGDYDISGSWHPVS